MESMYISYQKKQVAEILKFPTCILATAAKKLIELERTFDDEQEPEKMDIEDTSQMSGLIELSKKATFT